MPRSSHEQVQWDAYRRLCLAFLQSKGLSGTEEVKGETILNLMIEFTDVTAREFNRVITDSLVDYVQKAVKQMEVLEWVADTDTKKSPS